jgi:hypothetical protein
MYIRSREARIANRIAQLPNDPPVCRIRQGEEDIFVLAATALQSVPVGTMYRQNGEIWIALHVVSLADIVDLPLDHVTPHAYREAYGI